MSNHSNPSASRPQSTPWWLDDTSESCAHCLQGYAYGLHYHCMACDGAVCGLCVVVSVRVGSDIYCPDCAEAEENE
jgi:hypothetical protein